MKNGYNTTGYAASITGVYFGGAVAGAVVSGVFLYGVLTYEMGQFIWNGFKESYNQWYSNYIYSLTGASF